MISTPDVHTLTGPDVLDALPDSERLEFEQHLMACTTCSIEMSELREAAVKLAWGIPTTSPARLRTRVLAAISQIRQLHPESRADGTVLIPRPGLGRWSSLTLAAAALAVALAGGIAIDQYRDKATTSRQNQQVAAVLAEADARTVHGKVSGGGVAGNIAVDLTVEPEGGSLKPMHPLASMIPMA